MAVTSVTSERRASLEQPGGQQYDDAARHADVAMGPDLCLLTASILSHLMQIEQEYAPRVAQGANAMSNRSEPVPARNHGESDE